MTLFLRNHIPGRLSASWLEFGVTHGEQIYSFSKNSWWERAVYILVFVVVPSLSIHPLRKYVKRREREDNVKSEKRGHGRMSLKSFSLISVFSPNEERFPSFLFNNSSVNRWFPLILITSRSLSFISWSYQRGALTILSRLDL